jgi:hypothetical protein
MSRIVLISSSAPSGINPRAARSSAVLNEPCRKLPESPTILIMRRA